MSERNKLGLEAHRQLVDFGLCHGCDWRDNCCAGGRADGWADDWAEGSEVCKPEALPTFLLLQLGVCPVLTRSIRCLLAARRHRKP